MARGIYEEKGDDGKRKYTVAEIAETFGVFRKTVYRHLGPSGGRCQPGRTTPLLGGGESFVHGAAPAQRSGVPLLRGTAAPS